MRSGFAVFLAVFLSVYGVVNFYIGWHGWRFFRSMGIVAHGWVYWPLFWLLASLYLLSRAVNHHLPDAVYEASHFIGAYWLAAMMYLFLILLAIDLVRLLDLAFRFLPSSWLHGPRSTAATGIAIGVVVLSLLAWGSRNAVSPVVTTYEIDVPKRAGNLRELDAVLVSDIHLGTIVNRKRLESLVARINALGPDVVFLAGDVLDEDVGPFVDQGMSEVMKKLAAPLGVYAIPGNHEYIGGHLAEFASYLEDAGVKVLIDRTVTVAGAFHIVGRDDLSGARMKGSPRKPLSELVAGLDPSLPLVLMDHQPFDLGQAEKAGIDLQLSGHTHRGQLFPNNLVTRKIFELDYGYKKKGSLNVVVSSGYGTWGPPVRIGSRSEIVRLKLRFSP